MAKRRQRAGGTGARFEQGEFATIRNKPFGEEILGWATKNQDYILKADDEIIRSLGPHYAYKVYRNLMLDIVVQKAMTKLGQEIISKEASVEPVSQKPYDQAIAAFCYSLLLKIDIDEVTSWLMEADITGISVIEVVWKETALGSIPVKLRWRDPRRFIFIERNNGTRELRMLTKSSPTEGVPVPPRKFIVHRHWVIPGESEYGLGLGAVLYSIVKFNRRALESHILYNDRFANPTAVVTVPANAQDDEVDAVYDYIANMSEEMGVVLPEGFTLTFASPGGNADAFSNLRTALSRDIAQVICGEAEVGDPMAGSRASSEVANEVRLVRAKESWQRIAETLDTTLLRWIVDLNFGTDVQSPWIKRDFEPKVASALTMGEVVSMVKDLKLRPTKTWVAETYAVDLEEEDQLQIPKDDNQQM